jgi:hypothetical protein
LFYVPPTQTTYEYYTASLPPSVGGKALEIRITDTINTTASASVIEKLHIDYLAVLTDTFGEFERGANPVEVYSEGYYCVRLGNLNGGGDLGMEVILAKDAAGATAGVWKAYELVSMTPENWDPLPGWTDSSTTFFARGDTKIDLHSSMASDENPIKDILMDSSPRLFRIEDVNGDGFSDIIVVNTTIASAVTSQVALYINMWGDGCDWLYYVVKDIAGDFTITDVRGGMTWLEVDNLVTY